MRQHRAALSITALVGAVVLAACSTPSGTGPGSGGGKAREGGTVTVGLAEAPDALDPTVARTYVGRIVFANLCEKLYDIDGRLNLVPQLAAGLPAITDGGRTYTIKLRPGVRFNDGTALDAKAVKTTLDHYMTDDKSTRAAELSDVKSVSVVDAHTVRLALKTPFAPLTSILADRSGMILSPRQLDKLGDDFSRDPVCAGPFQFKSRPSSDEIHLVKSNYYYDKAAVHLAGVNFTVVSQPNVRAANLRSGDIDIADRVRPPDVATLEKTSGVKLDPVTSLGYEGITINVSNSNGAGKPPHNTIDKPISQHPELRQAFSLALDRDTINKVVFLGQFVPGCTPISPVSPYTSGAPCPGRNLAEAKRLVAQSGAHTPIKVQLIVQSGDTEQARVATLIKSMVQPAGFDVSVRLTEFTTALDQAQGGKFEAFRVGWSGRLDPDQNIAQDWDPASAINYSGADYPDVTKLIAQERGTTDQARRKQIFTRLTQALNRHGNVIYLYYEKNILGYSTKVSGIQYFGDGLIRLKTAERTG
jgi:peptide/nickel transport system substrate-binding protein